MVNELCQADAVMLEVGLQVVAVHGFDFVVDDGDTSLQRSVDTVERGVFRAEDAVGDLDGGGQGGRHDALDRRRIRSRNAATLANAVNVGREDTA